jgi:hypothetical protein
LARKYLMPHSSWSNFRRILNQPAKTSAWAPLGLFDAAKVPLSC